MQEMGGRVTLMPGLGGEGIMLLKKIGLGGGYLSFLEAGGASPGWQTGVPPMNRESLRQILLKKF